MGQYYGVERSEAYLEHYGVKGMKWGVRNGPPYPIGAKYDSPKSMSNEMKRFKYSAYSRLQSPEETFRKKSGSCHDQVMFEMQELQRMGYEPKATFVIEHDGHGQGGITHSYIHYREQKKQFGLKMPGLRDLESTHIHRQNKSEKPYKMLINLENLEISTSTRIWNL